MTNRIRCVIATSIILISLALITMNSCTHGNGGVPRTTAFELGDDGIRLHGGYRFATALGGDLFALYRSDDVEVIPPGAVLSVIKTAYCMGYFDGEAFYYQDGQRIHLDRIFFVISSKGNLDFHEPHPDNRNFVGPKILETVRFL